MNADIAVLAGDGIGPEVTAAACKVVSQIARAGNHRFTCTKYLIGGASIDRFGVPLTDEVLAACSSAHAVLLGAVGGPAWDGIDRDRRPERGLLRLRKELELFANLRPVRPHPALESATPFVAGHLRGVDILVVRELTGGVYFGQPRFREGEGEKTRAVDTMEYSVSEIRRVAALAFRLARGRRKKVTSVDKANVLETSRLWRETVNAVGADFPDVTLDHMLVDTAAMRLVSAPGTFDVLVTENMFGDILTDEAAVLAGSMGMLPSASLGSGTRGLYEPIHGSAPDIAGKGKANPLGAILSVALLFRHSLGLDAEAARVERAVSDVLARGCRTADLGGSMSTEEMTGEVLSTIAQGER